MGHDDPDDPQRRAALGKLAIATGGVIAAAAAVGPIGVALSPLVRKDEHAGDSDGWVRVDNVARFEVGALPARVVMRRDVRDSWLVRRGETLGAVLVERLADNDFRVLSAVCPHLGCSVVWEEQRAVWLCPCHKSAFTRDGALKPADSGPPNPSPRALDPLEWRVYAGVLSVRWVRYKTGIAEREPVSAASDAPCVDADRSA